MQQSGWVTPVFLLGSHWLNFWAKIGQRRAGDGNFDGNSQKINFQSLTFNGLQTIVRLTLSLITRKLQSLAGFFIATFSSYYFAYNAKYIFNSAIFAISFSRTYCTTLQNPYWAYVACYTSEIITLACFLFRCIVKICVICKT